MITTENIQDKYSELTFEEEGHKYLVDGKSLTSTSNLVHMFVEEFDTEGKAIEVAAKKGTTPEIIKAGWKNTSDTACNFGTVTHNFGEDYAYERYLCKTSKPLPIPSNGHEEAVVKFWDHLPSHIVPSGLEIKMYSKIYGYAGTCDILLYNTITHKYIIADYKTNKDLFKNFRGKTMLTPFVNMLDMPYNHYVLQLSFYQILLEEQGVEVEDRIIIWLLPDGTYKLYNTKDLTLKLKSYLDENRRCN